MNEKYEPRNESKHKNRFTSHSQPLSICALNFNSPIKQRSRTPLVSTLRWMHFHLLLRFCCSVRFATLRFVRLSHFTKQSSLCGPFDRIHMHKFMYSSYKKNIYVSERIHYTRLCANSTLGVSERYAHQFNYIQSQITNYLLFERYAIFQWFLIEFSYWIISHLWCSTNKINQEIFLCHLKCFWMQFYDRSSHCFLISYQQRNICAIFLLCWLLSLSLRLCFVTNCMHIWVFFPLFSFWNVCSFILA